MNNLIGALIVLLVTGMRIAPADAASVIVREPEVIIRGELKTGDVEKIPQKGITTLVFEDSPGGSVASVFEYVDTIQRSKLKTKVRGKCFSACAIAFLAGTTRTVDREMTSIILFHLTSKVVDGARIRGTHDDAILKLIENLTGGHFSGKALELTKKSWSDNQGLVFYFGRHFFGKMDLTLYCDGTQGSDLSKCTNLKAINAKDLGVVN